MTVTKERRRSGLSVATASASAVRKVRLAAASTHDTPPAGNAALIAAELTIVRCRWCNDDLEHCHESLVVHAVGEVHCMGPNCSIPPELHHMIVDCDDFGCTCAQTAAATSTVAGAGGAA
jgi:hypothetical protein